MTDDLIERHIRALTEIVRRPNAEHVADAHNEAVRYLKEHATALREKEEEIARLLEERTKARESALKLFSEITTLKTVMIAAAEEIHEHWDAHCDAEGYGPANLMRRLEEGIPSEYGYTAGAFAQLKQRAEAAEERIRALEKLREAVEPMMAALSYHGQMSARGDLVSKVMDALAAIDAELKP